MNRRLLNDYCEKLARVALNIISPCLREEEWADAYQEFAAQFLTVLLDYEEKRARLLQRLGYPEQE